MFSVSTIRATRSNHLPGLKYVYYRNASYYTTEYRQRALDYTENLMRIMKINKTEAKFALTKYPMLVNKKPSDLRRIPVILEKYGVDPQLCFKKPFLLTIPHVWLESRILVYKETGIDYTGKNICRLRKFKRIMRTVVSTLRLQKILAWEDVVEKYAEEINLQKTNIPNWLDFIPKNSENATLIEVRSAMMILHISHLLNCQPPEAQKIVSKHHLIVRRSFCWTRESIQIMQELFGFSNLKIQQYGFLLHTPPAQLQNVFAEVSTLGDAPFVKLAHLCPGLLLQTKEVLKKIEDTLLSYDIPRESMSMFPWIFLLSESTIRQRLEEAKQIPEFAARKDLPRFLKLIYYHRKCKARLGDLKDQVFSLNTLTVTNSKVYNRLIEHGVGWRGNDVIKLLGNRLPGIPIDEIRKKLHLNPNWLSCPFVKMKEVLDYIQIVEKIDTKVIFEALPIVLYPLEKVQNAFQETVDSGEAKASDLYFLQMVLYMMEKSCGFTGDGMRVSGSNFTPEDFHLNLVEGEDEDDLENFDLQLEGEDDSEDSIEESIRFSEGEDIADLQLDDDDFPD